MFFLPLLVSLFLSGFILQSAIAVYMCKYRDRVSIFDREHRGIGQKSCCCGSCHAENATKNIYELESIIVGSFCTYVRTYITRTAKLVL